MGPTRAPFAQAGRTILGWLPTLFAILSLVVSAPLFAGPLPAAARPSDMLTWTPDQQAVGFRSLDRIFAHHIVRHGRHVRVLPRAAAQLDVRFDYKGAAYTTDSYMAAHRLSGVLVLKHGRIVLERYGLGRTSRDAWNGFSVTKSVTSSLVGAAVRDGFIRSLDDPVTHYLPEMAGSAYDQVSVRQLVTMSSGVRWTETYGDPASDVIQVGSAVAPPGMDPIVSYMRALPRVAPPGSLFHYKSGEADLVAVLVARAAHRPLADYLSEKIWRPYGMERDAVWVTDGAGFERGGCCLAMTLRDFGRYGQFMLEGGRAGGHEVLPAGWVAEATRAEIATGNGVLNYGYLWWVAGDGSYQANGIFGQQIVIVSSEDLVVVINADWPSASDADHAAMRAAFVSAVRKAAAK